MNTICNFPDIDIHLLYFLDTTSVLTLSTISKNQHTLMLSLDFVKELRTIVQKYNIFNYKFGFIDYAVKHNFLSLIKWFAASINKFSYNDFAMNCAATNGDIQILQWFSESRYEFIYDKSTIGRAARAGNVNVLEWFDKSKHEFIYYSNNLINECAEKGARRRLR